jgi:hypothetical protein
LQDGVQVVGLRQIDTIAAQTLSSRQGVSFMLSI